jgi:Amt family ammonium transporter
VPYLACTKLKLWLKYDDALDTFGIHGVGGTLGALLTGFLANPSVNANLSTNLSGIVGKTLWIEQLKAIGVTMTLAIGGSAAIAYAVKLVIGLRPSPSAEEQGLDDLDHGEQGYHGDEIGRLSHGDLEPAEAREPSMATATVATSPEA